MRSVLKPALIFAILFILHPARAQSGDPSQMFLNAYMAVQQGEKLERNGEKSEALSKFRYAASLLDQISSQYSDWQPLIIKYRKRKTREMILRIENTVALEGPGLNEALEPVLEGPLPTRGASPPSPSVEIGDSSSSNSMDSLELFTQRIRDRIRKLETQISEQRKQIDRLQRDKQELLTRLSDSMRQVDKARTDEAELRAQLTQTRTALDNALNDAAATETKEALEKRVAMLTDALQKARDESAVADEFAHELRNQIDRLQKTADKKIAALANERDEAVSSRDIALAFRDKALATRDEAIASRDEALASRNDAVASREKALASRDEAIASRDEALASRNDAIASRGKALASRDKAIASRDEALASRDEAVAALEKSKTAQEQVEKLKSKNETLLAQLEKTENTIKAFNKELLPRKGEEIAQLRKEVTTAKKMLAKAQQDSRGYQSSMDDLREQLDSANRNLAELKQSGTTNPEEMRELTRENELIRGIILRQLKEQARRDQAKKLVLAELANLEDKSDVLMNQIEYLGQPLVKLTQKERALFKDSQIDLPELEEPGAVEISIAASKSEAPGTPNPRSTDTELAGFNFVDSPLGGQPAATESSDSPQVETAQSPNVPAELVEQAKEARELFDRGKYREAELIYEKLQAEAPNNIYVLSNMGVVRFRSGKLHLAEEAFNKALAIDPNDSFSRCTLGIVFYQQGKYDEAINELTQALAVDPKNATAHNYLGITASQKGWPEAAQKEMETAIQLDPNYADAYFNLAVIHATWQPPNRGEAKRYYQKALSLGAQPDPALENLIE